MECRAYIQQQHGLEPWAEFNRIKWKCEARVMKFQCPDSDAYIESLFFLNKRGKLYLPPLNPFHPTLFHPTPTDKPYRVNRQWHQSAEVMIETMLRHGGTAAYCLPPDITDIRPFLWKGFKVNVKYTYHIQLPYMIDKASTEIRSKLKKAAQEGYHSRLSQDMNEVYPCLLETESRKGFSHNLTLEDLRLAQRLLGNERLRCYVCYTKEGEPVSASLIVVMDNGWAFGWVAGSKTAHLPHGVVQQSQYFAFQDLGSLGIQGIDLVGANLPSVAKSKASWGGELVPYYQVRIPVFKEILRSSLDWIRFKRTDRVPIFKLERRSKQRG